MENRNINYLLKTYDNNYAPGEQRSKQYNTQIKQKTSYHNKKEIAEDLFHEVPFHITETDKEQVCHLIRMYPNFKTLHKNASNETIILAFIFYVKIPYNTNIKLDKYAITTKYNLTHTTFELIICRLALNYLKEVYIIPTQPTTKSYEIISKGEEK